MNRIAVIALALGLATCSTQPPARQGWPSDKPEVDTLKVREGVVSVDRALSNKAIVKRDTLRFPAEQATQVMSDWPPGKVLIGQPADDLADKANNPFGFFRKVKSVSVVGAEVVVETEPARLDEALEGQFHKTFDFASMEPVELPPGTDLSAYDVELDTTQGRLFPVFPHDAGVDEQPLYGESTRKPGQQTLMQLFGAAKRRDAFTLSGLTLSAPERAVNLLSFSDVSWKDDVDPELELKMSGSIDFTPILSAKPALTIDYDWNTLKFRLDEFEFSAGVDGKLGAKLETSLSLLPKNPNLSAAKYTRALLKFGAVGLKYPIPRVPIATVSARGFLGPIPIVARASSFVECTDAFFKGSARVKSQASMLLSPRAGVHYTHKNGWEPITEFPFKDPSYSIEVLGNSAALQIDCGIYVRVEVLAAGVAGPYAQLRRSYVIDAERKEVCDPNAQKDHQANVRSTVQVRMFDAIQAGAEIDLIVASIEKGPYDLYRRNYKTVEGELMRNPNYRPGYFWFGAEFEREQRWEPIWTWSKDRPNTGDQRCEVGCDDGVFTAGGETDVDCGGPTCAKCKKGKACAVNSDCSSNVCQADKTCQGLPCDDDLKGEQETDVDCGGPQCAKCAAGKSCTVNTDCVSGVCGGNGRCVASLCEDGVKNADETDVDCGGPTCAPCALTKVCGADGDCAEGFCSRDAVSPKTCTDNLCRDNRLSGTEGDVDCGASLGCTRLCGVAQGCRTDADCESGACNLTTYTCAANSCSDGRTDRGETDVDCGGPCPTKCQVGDSCNFTLRQNADCASGQCSTTNVCVATACQNLRVDSNEVGTDCAGACSARCPYNETCTGDADCQTGLICHPLRRKCQPPGCDDGLKNGQESAIDCGGPACSKCAVSKSCTQNSDCVTGSCFNNRCISGPCENGVKDATEADVDCGGSCGSITCGLNKTCTQSADCSSNICAGGKCISDPCLDLVRNASETDVDCGGATCAARCAAGKRCAASSDCTSGQCNLSTFTCVASACEDGAKNGSESDVDCGGSCGVKCAVNRSCTANGDCASGVCNLTTLRCVPDRCADGVLNGTETAVDCGGACESKCAFNQPCVSGLDCQSGACTGLNRCAADQCSDGRLNGTETALDCGGTCATKCAVGQACLSGADCAHPLNLVGVPGYCALPGRTCVSTSCSTGLLDGDESDVDCGGSCSTKCALTKVCATNADCASGICHATAKTCRASARDDGLKNGDETDIDCGGSAPTKCAEGKGCSEPWDCSTGYCSVAGLCLPAIPRTCDDVPFAQRTGTGGLFTIDPDGPRQKRNGSYIPGRLRPIRTWCSFPSAESSGYTPIFYLNSQSANSSIFFQQTRVTPNTTGYSPYRSCTSNADCTQNPNDRCRQVSTGGICTAGGDCYCASDEVWPSNLDSPSMRQNPANLSVNQPNVRETDGFQYELPTAAQTDQVGFSRPFSPYRPQTFRWTAYRNGLQVFDSHYFTLYDLADTNLRQSGTHNYSFAAGPYTRANDSRTGEEDLEWLWCGDHSLPVYPTVTQQTQWIHDPFLKLDFPSPPYRLAVSSPPNIAISERCFGLPTSPIGRDPSAVSFIYGLMRERPKVNFSGSIGYTGLWWGRYGVGASGQGAVPYFGGGEAPPAGTYMGFCNGMSSAPSSTYASPSQRATQGTSCQAYHHLTSQSFQWYNNELSTLPDYGSAFQNGVPGLVFVLWAR